MAAQTAQTSTTVIRIASRAHQFARAGSLYMKPWEIDYLAFSRRPWTDIRKRYETDPNWYGPLHDFRESLADFDRERADVALSKLFETLQRAYPVRKSRVSATLNWISSDRLVAAAVEVGSAALISPLIWYVVVPHVSIIIAARLNNEIQRVKRRQAVKRHLNYLLEPIDGNASSEA